MEARLMVRGSHYIVDTPFPLKGRGITDRDCCWHEGAKQNLETWKSYKVTKKAFEKLERQYPIAMKCLLD